MVVGVDVVAVVRQYTIDVLYLLQPVSSMDVHMCYYSWFEWLIARGVEPWMLISHC